MHEENNFLMNEQIPSERSVAIGCQYYKSSVQMKELWLMFSAFAICVRVYVERAFVILLI